MLGRDVHLEQSVQTCDCSVFPYANSIAKAPTYPSQDTTPKVVQGLASEVLIKKLGKHIKDNKISLSSLSRDKKPSMKDSMSTTPKPAQHVNALLPTDSKCRYESNIYGMDGRKQQHASKQVQVVPSPIATIRPRETVPRVVTTPNSLRPKAQGPKPVYKCSNFYTQNLKPSVIEPVETSYRTKIEIVSIPYKYEPHIQLPEKKLMSCTPSIKCLNTVDSFTPKSMMHPELSTQFSNFMTANGSQYPEEGDIAHKDQPRTPKSNRFLEADSKPGMYFRPIQSIDGRTDQSIDQVSEVLSHGFIRYQSSGRKISTCFRQQDKVGQALLPFKLGNQPASNSLFHIPSKPRIH